MRNQPGFWFTLFVLALLAYALWSMMDFPTAGARRFPAPFAIPAFLLAALQLFLDWRNRHKREHAAAILDLSVDSTVPTRTATVRALRAFGWVFGFAGLTLLFSYYISLWVFVPAYLIMEAKASWGAALLATVVLALAIFGILAYGLNISVPHGLFFRGYFG